MSTIQIPVSVLEPPLNEYIGPDRYERFLINSIRTYKDIQETRIEKNNISISIEKKSNNSSPNTFILTISSPTENNEVIRNFGMQLCSDLEYGETIKPVTISNIVNLKKQTGIGGYRRRAKTRRGRAKTWCGRSKTRYSR